MNTETKRNWPSLVGLILLSGAVLYPFVPINGNASPFDHFLKAAYDYDDPNLDYGESGKPLMMQALPFDGEVIEDEIGVEDIELLEEVTPIDGPTTNSAIIQGSETIMDPITSELMAQPLVQQPTQGLISDSFPTHLPQEYIDNGQ